MDTALRTSKTTYPPQRVPTFSLAARDRRWDIGRKIMDEKDLKALVVFGSREGAFPAPYSIAAATEARVYRCAKNCNACQRAAYRHLTASQKRKGNRCKRGIR
jgi:hypothetical protein